MIIKCTFLLSPENGMDGCKQASDVPPLPEYIIKKGPYLNNRKGTFHQLIIVYKFDKSQLGVAWKCICEQLDSFRGLPGFTLSAHIYGPRPFHLSLNKERPVKSLMRYYPNDEGDSAVEMAPIHLFNAFVCYGVYHPDPSSLGYGQCCRRVDDFCEVRGSIWLSWRHLWCNLRP
jgi:hypothetical protein